MEFSSSGPASESMETCLLLHHENRSGSRLLLTGDPDSMLRFCQALRESATAVLPQKAEGETLRLPNIRIAADYSYHLSFHVTPDLTPLLRNPPGKSRLSTTVTAIVWLVITIVAVTVLRGVARVFFGI